MNNIAQTQARGSKIESLFSAQFIVPALLGVNTFALLALQQLGGMPDWIKTAAALFLSF
jgi:hypothetical protein